MLDSKKKPAVLGLGLALAVHAAGLAAAPQPPDPPVPTTLAFDQIGMPFVVAGDAASGYDKLCFAMAQDRLFQMDLLRRSAQGRLAQIFGAGPGGALLQQDKTLRVQGIAAHAQNRYNEANAHTRSVLSSCAKGINSFIGEATLSNTLPLEFQALGYVPEPWQPRDSVAILIYLGAGFSNIGTQIKLQRAALGGVFGPEFANDLIPPVPETSMFAADGSYVASQIALTAAAPKFSVPRLAAPEALSGLRLANLVPDGLSMGPLQATNAFVVAGARTQWGKPILANDPHLAMNMPAAFYFAQLKVTGTNGFNVRGATIPGVPVFLSAHNDTASWGISVAGIDGTDLYVETLNAAGTMSLHGSTWAKIIFRTETIEVGATPDSPAYSVSLPVKVTRHGPLLNSALPALDAFGPIALKDTFTQSAWKIDGYFDLPRTSDWTSFKSAVNTTGIGLNFLYADKAGASGNIGYQMAGAIPLRNPENLYVPVSGADGAHEWSGFATAAQRPSVLNPPDGFLAVANNRIVPSNYAPGGVPVSVGAFLEQPWRAQRATQLLQNAGNAVTSAALRQMQLDTYNAVGDQMAQTLGEALPPGHPDPHGTLAALQAWNGQVARDSKGALVFEVLTTLLIQDTYLGAVVPALGPELGNEFYQNYVQGVFVTRRVDALRRLLAAPKAPFFGIAAGDDETTRFAKRDAAIAAALAKTDALVLATLGSETASNPWHWGKLHMLTYNHPLAAPGNPFHLPSYPSAGDFATLDIGWWGTKAGILALPEPLQTQMGGAFAAFGQDAIAAFRLSFDSLSPANAEGILSTGQSGNPFSPHWADQAAVWRSGGSLPLSYEGIEAY